MDTNIPFIIQNVPYLWVDSDPSLGGLAQWSQKRFSRIYLTRPDQPLYQGYLFPPSYCPKIAEYFRAQTYDISPRRYNDIRLNGVRVDLDAFIQQNPYWTFVATLPALPVSVLYEMLNLFFRTLSVQNLKTINPSKAPFLIETAKDKIKHMFPPGIDYELIKITNIGAYSITHWKDTRAIADQMEHYIRKGVQNLTITDATAGIGGDTLCFARRFKHVNAVELVPLHCSTIANNLSVYKNQGKLNLICASYIDVVGFFKPWPGEPVTQNVVYFDPPWGGRQYKFQKNIVLKLDNVPLSRIIWYIIETRLAEYVFVKAPRNANLDHFPFYRWVPIRNFKLICIKTDFSK